VFAGFRDDSRNHSLSPSWTRGDSAASGRKDDATESSGNGDDGGHFEGKRGDLVGDRYRLGADMGSGTFGRVVECWDQKRRRPVAVKFVRKAYHESALDEAKILQNVNDRDWDQRRGRNKASLCVEMF
ncbi:unnamed protein product, partial [Ascophyllum nodosum]